MNALKSFSLVSLILLFIVATFSLFTVDQTQRSIILRLGKIQEDSSGEPHVLVPGLHFKVPFVDSVRHFDKRIQTLNISKSRIPTEEKKELIVDLFAKWRIKDFSLFFKTTGGNLHRAESLLKEKTVDGLRAEIGRRKLNDVVTEDRQVIMEKIRDDVNLAASTLGMEVVDARVMRIDLPQEVSESVYGLMRTERNRIAAEHRAKGNSRSEAIEADADRQVTVILATAHRDSKTLRGEGDAEAANIYASVYGKDPEFYRFYRSLEAYRETFRDKDDMLVIKPDNDFFRYFQTNKDVKPANSSSRSAG